MKKVNEKKIAVLVGERVRNLRRERGVSQNQLAFEAEISMRQLGRIERGEFNTTFLMLYKISRVLNVSVSEIVNFIIE